MNVKGGREKAYEKLIKTITKKISKMKIKISTVKNFIFETCL
jgi:hypothetical protein